MVSTCSLDCSGTRQGSALHSAAPSPPITAFLRRACSSYRATTLYIPAPCQPNHHASSIRHGRYHTAQLGTPTMRLSRLP